ncbi:MAG: hypothetical protein A2170_16965 [Deltaproteobacteria bacterium RBG_13_53_10]|nr:MAG: hypothetical protein A2170_16965 [Deltaproteobacteria bacterium RBG_13_53_10]
MLFGRFSERYRALAGREGVNIAFHSCRVNEKVPVGASKREEAVGMGDQAATGGALKCLGSIPPSPIGPMMIHAPSFAQNG